MTGGGFVANGPAGDFNGKITVPVVITCVVAASSGLIFGYDIGISGGVTTMAPFLMKFFPEVFRKASEVKTNMYCKFDSQVLTAFTSSLYIAGLASSLVASRLTAAVGRKNTIVLGGCTFLAGAAINGGAANIAMLLLGRILLGFGVGFTNQATPLYLSEVAPPKWRGAFSTGFQFFIGVGVVAANCINFGMAKHSWGWRFSLGLAVVPAAIMTTGALFISDTPSSLVERGRVEQARKSLTKVRGINSNVDAELADLLKFNEMAKDAKKEPFLTIFERQYRPHLVMSIAIPFFQQLTGINIIAFYAPVIFQSIGFGSNSALIAAIVLGLVNLGSILVSTAMVDRHGRRFLFIIGGIQMFICQVAVTVVLAVSTGISGTKHISKGHGILLLVLMCIYAAGFGWSWGPLSWLVPSEIFPMKIRPTGQSINVAVNFATTFVLSQTFLSMLCHFKFGTFLFYAGWIALMTVFVVFFLPETKGIPLDSMYQVWERHWYWGRFVRGSECLSLGLAAVPAAIMTVGALFILDTPSSLVEGGKLVEARQSLIKIRGNKSNVDDELAELVSSSELAKDDHEPLKTIFERRYRPHLVMAIAIPFFQQFTGIGVVAFYTPVVFSSVGSGHESALTAAVVLGAVNLGSILVSTVVVDRYGRRLLFIIGGTQMFICQVALSILLYMATGAAGTEKIPKGYDLLLLVFMCIYAAGFGWSWNPLTVLIPSEIFPMRIRATGVTINIVVAFSVTFVLSQFFLTMLCHLKHSLFLFYGCWIAVMTVFVVGFLPETRGIPLEKMDEVWKKHRYWHRFVGGQL